VNSLKRAIIVLISVVSALVVAETGFAQADPPTPPPIWILSNQQTGMCLTATDAASNFYVIQAPCNGSNAQRWQTEQIAPNGSYLMEQQTHRCLSALPGSSNLVTRDCDWNGYFHSPNGWDPLQRFWRGNGWPTTFYSSGTGNCLGTLPNNSLIWRLDCGAGAPVLWYF
jgi:hypothetical protein